MRLFKKKDGTVTDAQAYLRSTDNVSRPTAILMSLVAFLAVFAIVFSLFLGGKWLYDKLKDDNTVKEDTTQVVTSGPNTENSSSNNGLGITVVDGSGERTASVAGSQVAGTNDTTGTTQVAGVATEALPNTGPASTLLIVAVAVAIGTTAHNAYTRKNA